MSTATKPRVRQPGPLPKHGTSGRYRRGCTCPPCTTAETQRVRKWKYLRQTGRSGYVPSGLAIARIWRLRAAGMTDVEIREAAKLGPSHIYQILRTKAPLLHTTAARILAVPAPAPTDEPTRNGASVPSLGTMRRLQALTAEGWPASELDRRTGAGRGYTAYLLRGKGGDTMRLSTAAKVTAVCSQLDGITPEDHGINRQAARQARSRAKANGWPGLGYWDPDDFDNPDFVPATAEPPRYLVLAENGLELERHGHTREQAAERLGVTKDNLQQSISRYRKAQQEAA
ncbi:hypothetical protein [Streptomyces candidus]|uniref:Uncharacterized protein n=1 Tax=Streptomyces candidus TaxID=67283 RepID=A0A7X0HLI7_9ACTN|nr:hypothetical protein [Streptomyces candidus]MBB6439884.1 hypothetical protein [Streptomyces candidus]GHH58004.1 hypothetical protein GCM10018773_65950 [Streptomyces candidus]